LLSDSTEAKLYLNYMKLENQMDAIQYTEIVQKVEEIRRNINGIAITNAILVILLGIISVALWIRHGLSGSFF